MFKNGYVESTFSSCQFFILSSTNLGTFYIGTVYIIIFSIFSIQIVPTNMRASG